MNSYLVRSALLKETYPAYKAAGYTLQWLDPETIEVVWNYGVEKHSIYRVDELCELITINGDFGGSLDAFIYASHPIDYVEAYLYGTLGFSSSSKSWNVISNRPGDLLATAFLNTFSPKEIAKILKMWSRSFRPDDFQVTSQSLIVEISSRKKDINPIHALHSREALSSILQEAYDISDETCILIDDNPQGNILIGHHNAVERLAEIPGSNYSLKTYQDIHNELWRKNVA